MHTSYIEISKDNLLHNLAVFQSILPPNTKVAAVVKAYAYGHGMREIVSILEGKVEYFQVDDIEELRALRAVTAAPVLVLGYVANNDLEEFVALDGILGVFDIEQIAILDQVAQKKGKIITVHLEVDALLGRLGITADNVKEFIEQSNKYKHVRIEFLFAHFSDIEDADNLDHARRQVAQLKNIAGVSGIPFHIAATSGVLTSDTNWGGSLLRLGIGLYGLWPSTRLANAHEGMMSLLPVLSWKTQVAQVKTLPAQYPIGYGRTYITERKTTIAVIPQGYSDGYDRGFSNNGEVLIHDVRCPVLGRIAMNMVVVDVSDVDAITQGEEVVLIGRQGAEEITATELADRIGTINYEVAARISPVLPRITA